VGVVDTAYVATEVRPPVLPSRLRDWIAEGEPTNRYLPLGSLITVFGCAAVLDCEIVFKVSDPSLPTEYVCRFWLFATYMYFPELSIKRAVGLGPVCPMGEPAKALSDPSELTLNSEIEPSSVFAVYKNLPPESIVSPYGALPVLKGDPATGELLNTPALTENA